MKKYKLGYTEIKAEIEDYLARYETGVDENKLMEIINLKLSFFRMVETSSPGDVDVEVLNHPETLISDIKNNYWTNITPDPVCLHDDTGHVDWKGRWDSIKWKYWERYRKYLRHTGMKESAVIDLHKWTNYILELMEDPSRKSSFLTKGLVIGHVQSGKTANYIGLITKAADAGYKHIIVLTGILENLRSQTQKRLDAGFLGYSTSEIDFGTRLGVRDEKIVGMSREEDMPPQVSSYTTSDIKGDFGGEKWKVRTFPAGPSCFVVKKDKDILPKVLMEILQLSGLTEDDFKQGKVSDIPLLIIDDEADNASVNAESSKKKTENENTEDIRKINGLIRQILKTSSRAAYVGYTATPYANIFIGRDKYSDNFGKDLFPENFIIALEASQDYFGALKFFGDKSGEGAFKGITEITTADYNQLVPPDERKNKLYMPKKSNIPDSLIEAIYTFILVVAVRRIRSRYGKKNINNSMLIHVNQYSEVQNNFKTLMVEHIIPDIRTGLIDDEDQSGEVYSRFREIWLKFNETSGQIREEMEHPDRLCTPVTWEEIAETLPSVIDENFKVIAVNSKSGEKLNYNEYPDGLSAICIGGNSLSRGLTLDGLSVSYFVRDAASYDTLMQMGRWFGYRPGYLDLCRVYIRKSTINKFRIVAAADLNLREQIRIMREDKKIPGEYPLMVMENDPHFRACQLSKRRGTKLIQVGDTYSGSLKQTNKAYQDLGILAENHKIMDDFISSLGVPDEKPSDEKTGNYIWRNVTPEKITEGLSGYIYHNDERNMGKPLFKYINTQFDENNELTSWTVALIQKKDSPHVSTVGGYNITLSGRSSDSQDPTVFSYKASRGIISPSDESLDLTNGEKRLAEAFRIATKEKGKPLTPEERDTIRSNGNYSETLGEEDNPEYGESYRYGTYVRMVRPASRGLMLIYAIEVKDSVHPLFLQAFSFPGSTTAVPDEDYYRTQEIWLNIIRNMEVDD